jgi:hypothetical protein
LGGQHWATVLTTDTIGPLAPGDATAFAVVVTVPADGMAYERDSFIVTATSAYDPRTPPFFALGGITTVVNAIYHALATPATDGRSAYPGDDVTYRLQVANLGNVSDTYTAAYSYLSGSRWPVSISPAGPFTLLPGASQAGVVEREHLVSNGLDLFATVCDYAQVEPPAELPGRSVRPLVEGRPVADWREELFLETRFDKPGPQVTEGWAVVARRYKYCVYNHLQHREQLFDLDADPGEMVNLAVSAKHRPVLDEMRERVRSRLAAGGQKSVI